MDDHSDDIRRPLSPRIEVYARSLLLVQPGRESATTGRSPSQLPAAQDLGGFSFELETARLQGDFGRGAGAAPRRADIDS